MTGQAYPNGRWQTVRDCCHCTVVLKGGVDSNRLPSNTHTTAAGLTFVAGTLWQSCCNPHKRGGGGVPHVAHLLCHAALPPGDSNAPYTGRVQEAEGTVAEQQLRQAWFHYYSIHLDLQGRHMQDETQQSKVWCRPWAYSQPGRSSRKMNMLCGCRPPAWPHSKLRLAPCMNVLRSWRAANTWHWLQLQLL